MTDSIAPREAAALDGRYTVLIVDDEADLVDVLSAVLTREGWVCARAASGESAVRQFKKVRPDIVILDMMLPDFDGLEVLRRIRAIDPAVLVLFLTARDSVDERIAGITAGGDDYVAKPFSLEEVIARLRGLMRRLSRPALETAGTPRSGLAYADVTMDEDARLVHRGGDVIALTTTEFELLRYLLRNPERVLSKSQILDRVWQYDFGGQAHVVELYISYLRKKLDNGRAPLIQTVRGLGYMLRSST
ncbi:DNA-binding response regulator [Nakamurella antarctica]|uniref:DNA-binding response regulator n=1 Tax=Nakamurella antarctica TaxID=1902245 RepID=A0A3G8ZN61_9ACTN|nr:response regulator transcription factor [Nakamurella antarctica]AZI58235.1 DNA-binding response regulator [Nakamurella antarctica]